MTPAPHAEALARIPVARRSGVFAGAATRWWEYGPADGRADAPVIIAAHGYRGDHHGIEPVIAHLPEFRIINPDLPGYGESGPLPGRHTLASYANWLQEFAAAASGGAPYVMLGHSFGTILTAAALDDGLISPERIILMNPIANPPLRGSKAAGTWFAAAWYRLSGVLPEQAGRRSLSARVMVDGMSALTTKTRDRELRRWIKEEHRRYFNDFHSLDSVVEGFEASVSDHVSAHAEAFRVPTLLIAAAKDQITAVKDVRRLQSAIKGSELVVLDGVGHLIHYERPAEAAQAIRDFLG